MANNICERCGDQTKNGLCLNCGHISDKKTRETVFNAQLQLNRERYQEDESNPNVAYTKWRRETKLGRYVKPCNIVSTILIILFCVSVFLCAAIEINLTVLYTEPEILFAVSALSFAISTVIILLCIPLMLFNEVMLIGGARNYCIKNNLELKGGANQHGAFMMTAYRMAHDKKKLILHCVFTTLSLECALSLMFSVAVWPFIIALRSTAYTYLQTEFNILSFLSFLFGCALIFIQISLPPALIGAAFTLIEKRILSKKPKTKTQD